MIFELKAALAETWRIEPPLAPWLWPLLAILGILVQLAALAAKKRALLIPGLVLVYAGTLPDRDLTLLIGDTLACCGLWYCLAKRS